MLLTDTFKVTHNKVGYRVTTRHHLDTNSVVACIVHIKTGQIVFRPEAIEGLEDAVKAAHDRLYQNKSKSKKNKSNG